MDNPANEVVEQPFYVNAKQYHRILKRRVARAKLEESLKVARGRRPYLHESRHKHAMRRPRGQGGRFLTAAEIAEKERKEAEEKGSHKSTDQDDDHSSEASGKYGSVPEAPSGNGTLEENGNAEAGSDGVEQRNGHSGADGSDDNEYSEKPTKLDLFQ
jgi:nuclear transcription factor Y alpha